METGRDSAGKGRVGVEGLLRRPADVELVRLFKDIAELYKRVSKRC